MRLSQFDKSATDPGAPFGGGVSSMGGGSDHGSGTAAEASPHHQGPPPAAAGASHIIRCNECGYMATDGGDLEEHMRKEHFVRESGKKKGVQANDVSIPASLVFIDALGDTLPFKAQFTFKELSDFCRREGLDVISGQSLNEHDLIRIAERVAFLTHDHVQITAQPTKGGDRDPLSAIDLGVAAKEGEKTCRRCSSKIASYRVYCDSCRTAAGVTPPRIASQDIHMYAHVMLKDGASLHVVEIGKDTLIGVDDFFVPREFTAADASTVHNMEDDLRTIEAAQCTMCGEERYAFASKCSNCGAP